MCIAVFFLLVWISRFFRFGRNRREAGPRRARINCRVRACAIWFSCNALVRAVGVHSSDSVSFRRFKVLFGCARKRCIKFAKYTSSRNLASLQWWYPQARLVSRMLISGGCLQEGVRKSACRVIRGYLKIRYYAIFECQNWGSDAILWFWFCLPDRAPPCFWFSTVLQKCKAIFSV